MSRRKEPGNGRLPSITIVVPSYNQASYLEEALSSLVAQGYPDLELVVMDGGSSDGSLEVIKCYERHLAYWQSRPDGGQSAAIREGFAWATGDVLGWLNSDDLLCGGALLAVGRAFRDSPRVQWLYGHSLVVDAHSQVMHRRRTVPVKLSDMVSLNVYLPQESTFFRRSLYSQVGGLDTDLSFAMDYDLWLKFYSRAKPLHLDAYLGCFRYVPGQKSAQVKAYRQEEELVKQPHMGAGYSTTRRLAALVSLVIRTALARVRAEGWRGVYRLPRGQWRILIGSSPQLGTSRRLAALVLGALLASLLVSARLVISVVQRRP